ncbi:hypothetical protein [Sphingomonas sp. MS122]|uniref:hypothetical protein n=1 Tax=Sphingomonas sp. MS122 TaxID=3412683 RepID=UPI003C2D3059
MTSAALGTVLDALAEEAPEPVARGRAALERTLAWTGRTSWGDVAWSFSDLAGGCPVELVWRPGWPGLFWTAEPAAPEWPTPRRMKRALALARMFGARFDRAQAARLGVMVARSAPWPVWLGGRHDASGDETKLYALIDADAVGGSPLLRGDDCPVMLGLSPDGGTELYWRRRSRLPGDRWRLAREPGLAPLVDRLDAALVDWTGNGLEVESAGRIGLSLKRSRMDEPEALAAFVRVRQAGGEAALRERLLAAGGDGNPALARLWAAGRLRPMFLTLAVTPNAMKPSIGFRMNLSARNARQMPELQP